jgi:hypothetical protein
MKSIGGKNFLRSFILMAIVAIAATQLLIAQSTFGTILGTVKDANGNPAPGVQVKLLNTGTSASRVVYSDGNGNFAFNNIDVGTYSVTFSANGFQTSAVPEIALTARETQRVDTTMKLASQNQTVVVLDTMESASVITTDESNLAATKVGTELETLPVAIYSRAAGSTSPISTLTTEAGVQTDPGGNLIIAGTTPALLSTTLDGIASMAVEYSGPSNELFPSFNSIEEIRVSETNNNAEFSGVADITTISKAGTNKFHGGIYENLENTVFNAGNSITGNNPKIIMNDFGATLGGPLILPKYNGHDKTFFFFSFEGLRLPRETPTVLSVPSNDMRNGYLVDYLAGQGVSTIYNADGTVLDPTSVPINPISANILTYLYPTANYGAATDYQNNYRKNLPAPISDNQGDARFDHTISARQNIFARFSYKNRQITATPNMGCGFSFCQDAGGPLPGPYNEPEVDEGLTFAHNFVFSQNLLNEFRGGYNARHASINQNFSTTQLLTQLGLTVPQPDLQWAEAPFVAINGFMFPGNGNPTKFRSQIVQLLDNVTWMHGRHSFKFGADFKRLSDHDDNVYGNYRSGWYAFDGSSPVGGTIGDPFTEFLLGYPDYTYASTVNKQDMNGIGYGYAMYAQDDWKITPRLTLNLGLRYELHPPLVDSGHNTGYFLPSYTANTSGGQVNGAVVVEDSTPASYISSDLQAAVAPTPFLTASQAGLPGSLRYTYKKDFGPRIGFAWRPFGNDKNVIRGGWGKFFETPLGFSLVSGFGTEASYVSNYSQGYQPDGITPILSFQDSFNSAGSGGGAGTAGFYWAFPIHYIDPSVMQWNLTYERDMGHHIGLRVTYTGSHGSNLETIVDGNQVAPNSDGYYNVSSTLPPASGACLTYVNDGTTQDATTVAGHRPFPCWSVIETVTNLAESNYNGATVQISRRGSKNLTFDASYTFTRHLANDLGATPNNGLVGVTGGAAGGNYLSDKNHPGLDYGNVNFDHRHRFLATYMYSLPFGKGQRWANTNNVLNALVGNWQLAGVTVYQSGPFLTPYEQSTDPAGTNILTTVGQARADIVPHVSLYAAHKTVNQWLNPAAFAIPADSRGYFGTAGVGSVVGPGTQIWSMSLFKDFIVYHETKFGIGIAASNLFNHRNYLPPVMQVDAANFGAITALQTAEGAGPRNLEISAHLNF